MISEYTRRKNTNATKLLTEIICIIDEQINELESSEAIDEDRVFEIKHRASRKLPKTLKLEGRRSEYYEAVDQTEKTDPDINTLKSLS